LFNWLLAIVVPVRFWFLPCVVLMPHVRSQAADYLWLRRERLVSIHRVWFSLDFIELNLKYGLARQPIVYRTVSVEEDGTQRTRLFAHDLWGIGPLIRYTDSWNSIG
jgi:hypothetical protein